MTMKYLHDNCMDGLFSFHIEKFYIELRLLVQCKMMYVFLKLSEHFVIEF